MERLAWILLAMACACGGPPDRAEIESQAREAASVAAQGAFLADHAGAGRSTDAYRRGHAAELRAELARCRDKLAAPALEPVAEAKARLLRAALPRVDDELAAVERGSLTGAAGRLRALAGELRAIRLRSP
jgi:hypothetical protein